jgi:GR25 family glycosyltransferase involved in LPS biosynthesis
MKRFCAVTLLSFSLLCGGVIDHLRQVDDQTPCRSLPHIDTIYVINLDKRPEKYALVSKELSKYGITPQRFSAINGWELPLDTIRDIGVSFAPSMPPLSPLKRFTVEGEVLDRVPREGEVYFAPGMTRGAIGTALSHLSVIRDAYDKGHETIWILEDDITAVQDPRLLSDVIERLNDEVGRDGWDLLFTDFETRNQRGEYVETHKGYFPRLNFTPEGPFPFHINYPCSPLFRRVEVRSGAYSMVLRRSGMRKLLEFFATYNLFHPYDVDYLAPPGMRAYSPRGDIVISQTGIFSDNRQPGYLAPNF